MIPILFVYLTPFYILLGTAFKAPNDYSSRWVMPGYLYLKNFETALASRTTIFDSRIFQGIKDSLIVTVITVVLIVIIGSLAAYPLARKQSKLNKVVRTFIVGVMMVPPLSILVPMYKVMIALKAISTYYSVILLLLTFQLPLAIFIYSRFISSIPVALDEAAAIDGCGPLRTFFSIILPQMKPVTVSVVILTGVTCWNDYQFSLYMLQSPKITSVTLAVSGFFAQVSSNAHAAAAAATLGVLPIVIIFLVLQKYFIQGMVDSAVK
jgi:raffinose/stachyose/melibiose transport system permease protein